MPEQFLQGVQAIEIDDGIRPIQTVKSSVIGLIGTAPLADATEFPLNTPVLLIGQPRKAALLGDTGTLKDAVDGIFDQAGAMVVIVRVDEGANLPETISNIVGDATLFTGVHAFLSAQSEVKVVPRILCAPGFTSTRPQGVQSIAITNGGTNYTDAGTAVTITDAGDGAGAEAKAVIADGVITGITVTRTGSGYTNATVNIVGDGADGAATATLEAVANPVVAEMVGIAERMRSVIIADGPNSTSADAITYREDWGSDRIYVVDPHTKVWDTTLDQAVDQPTSARVAGLISKMDNEKGFWWSPSNQVINGIVGISRPIDFALSDVNSEANYLNENEVATVIHKDGYRLWGNRSCSSDPLWAFLSVRRTADMIYESIEDAMLWAMDRPFSKNLVLDIQGSVNAYLRHLVAVGAILGGKAWLDEELNTQDQLMAGKLYIDFDIEPPGPLEHLIFRAHRNSGYYEELVAEVLAA